MQAVQTTQDGRRSVGRHSLISSQLTLINNTDAQGGKYVACSCNITSDKMALR